MKTDYYQNLLLPAERRAFLPACAAILALLAALNVHDDATFPLVLLELFLLATLALLKLFNGYQSTILWPTHPLMLAWLAFVAWCTLSLCWSPVKGLSFLTVLTLLTGPLSLLVGFWADDRQWQWFFRLLGGLVVLVVGLTSYQAFVLHIDRPAGFLHNWNTNSAFIGAIALPYMAVALRQISQRAPAWPLAALIGFCGFGMALGQGRASLLALALALALLSWTYRRQPRAGVAIAGVWSWLIGGFLLGDLLHGGQLGQRLLATGAALSAGGQTADSIGALGSGREYLWAAGWNMYLDRPWLGWGIGLFHSLYPQYRSPLHVEDGFFVHNDYLQFLLELGPIGLLLCLAWVLALLGLTWLLFRQTPTAEQRYLDLGLGLACLAMLLHTVVDFHLYHTPMLLILGAYGGRLARQRSQLDSAAAHAWQPASRGTRTGYFTILAGLALLLTLGLLNLALGFKTTHDLMRVRQPTETLALLNRAEGFLPFVEQYEAQKGILILNMLKLPAAQASAEDRELLLNYGLQQLAQSIQSNPLSAKLLMYQAELLQMRPGQQEPAIAALRQALRVDPYQLAARLSLAKLLQQRGEQRQAAQLLADGLNKAYVIDQPTIVIDFWRAIEQALGPSPQWQAQRQRVRQELDSYAASPVINLGKRILLTLPDIGWRPSA